MQVRAEGGCMCVLQQAPLTSTLSTGALSLSLLLPTHPHPHTPTHLLPPPLCAADLEAAVEGAMAAKFRNAGQTCVCANTLYVHSSLAAAFTQRLTQRVAALVVGDGLVPGTQVGPLISPAAVAAQQALLADALSAGAAVVATGGAAPPPATGTGPGRGNFFSPTVLSGLSLGSSSTGALRCVREEVFGPLAPVVAFDSEAQVLAAANSSSAGLAAYIFTASSARAWRVGGALQVGMVGVNTGLISAAQAPFGGVKDSGYGREGGRAGLHEYMDTKYTMVAF